MLEVLIYGTTIAAMFFFGFLEKKMRRQLTDPTFQPSKNPGDFGFLNDLSERRQRQRILSSLP
jgi:hypothetical protein